MKNTKELVLRITDIDKDRLEKIRCELEDKMADLKDDPNGYIGEYTDWEFKLNYRQVWR